MPITLEEPKAAGLPVVKRQAIGERFIGAVVDQHQRDVLKNGERVMKDNGKPRQELVVTVVTMPGSTATASIGDHASVPAPGELVRVILRGGGFGDWIEAKNSLPAITGVQAGQISVGDVVEQVVEFAQAYDAGGKPTGPKLTTQEQANAVPRSQAVGFYGPLTLRRANPDEASWVGAAETAYHERKQRTQLDDEGPFDGAPQPGF